MELPIHVDEKLPNRHGHEPCYKYELDQMGDTILRRFQSHLRFLDGMHQLKQTIEVSHGK